MVRVMSFYSGVMTRHVYGWIFIISLTSVVGIAVSEGVELQVTSPVEAQCGENVTLTCEATPSQLDIKYFAWLAENITCKYEDPQPGPGVLCEKTPGTDNPRLTLTLLSVTPANHGNYLCKIRSNQGVNSSTTLVTVQTCLGGSDSSISESHAKCSFSGVYPSGIIHWFQGDINLTESGSTQEEEDQNGRYNIWSTINVQKGNVSQPYECSLWIPSVGMYISSQQLHTVKAQTSAGRMVKLQWIFIMVEIMMVKCMT